MNNEIAAFRRTRLRELFRDMPVEDVALVLWDRGLEYQEELADALDEIMEAEAGPQDDDHLNYGGETVEQAHERARQQREEI